MAHITGTTFTLAHFEDRLWSVATAETVNLNGTQYVYATRNVGYNQIRVFSVAADGSLISLGGVSDTTDTALGGAWDTEIFSIDDTTYLAVAGQTDDGVSIFAVQDTAPFLTHVDTVFDSEDALYELDAARYLSVHQIGGNTFLTVTAQPWQSGTSDDGITVLKVANDGTLSVASVFADPSGTSARNGWPSETFEVDGTYYFAVGDPFASRFSIMSIDPLTGSLAVAVAQAGQEQPRFNASQITVHEVDGVPYLFVPSDDQRSLFVYTYDGGADVIPVTSATLTVQLAQAYVSAVYEVGDRLIVGVGSNGKSAGVQLFDFDAASGTLTELQWMPGPNSSEPETQPLQDVYFGPSFMIDGQPYALIISDDDNSINVYAIGGGDDVLDGTMQADLVEGYGGNDTITGFAGDDVLMGFDGDDTILGGQGDDQLFGGAGNDYLQAGLGNDLINGGDGDDTMLGLGDNEVMYGGAGNDIMKGGAGADLMRGNDGDDEIVGGDGHDDLGGQSGNDFMNGGAGNDVMDGNAGLDRMFGGNGNDDMDGGGGDDLLKGNDGDDTLFGGEGNDILAGQQGDDILDGGDGDDVIQGGGGQDRIIAGDGNDLLTGGSAVDTFVFDTVAGTGGGFNRITDFMDGTDLLDLIAYGFADATAALSGAVQADSDVNLTLSDGQIVWLENFLLTDLDGSDLLLS